MKIPTMETLPLSHEAHEGEENIVVVQGTSVFSFKTSLQNSVGFKAAVHSLKTDFSVTLSPNLVVEVLVKTQMCAARCELHYSTTNHAVSKSQTTTAIRAVWSGWAPINMSSY